MKSNTKSAITDMAQALQGVFGDYTLSARKAAWNKLVANKSEMNALLAHPARNRFANLSFKEWLCVESCDVKKMAQDNDIKIDGIDLDQLCKGFAVEKEHGTMGKDIDVIKGDMSVALKIAVAHLREDPEYYSKLDKMENESEEYVQPLERKLEWAKMNNVEVTTDGFFVLYHGTKMWKKIREDGKFHSGSLFSPDPSTSLFYANQKQPYNLGYSRAKSVVLKVKINPNDIDVIMMNAKARNEIKLMELK